MADFMYEVFDSQDEKKTNLKSETLTFSAKKHFFEKEIHEQSTKSKTAKQFSYFSEHELAKMRQEEETKANSMTKEELLSRATDNISSGEEEFNQVLASFGIRMKSLEDDAIRAQAVIHKAQEMQMEISKEEAKAKASKLEPFEITFADDEGYVQPSDQNGDTKPSSLADGNVKLIVNRRTGETSVHETSQVIDEKVVHRTIQVVDEVTGKAQLQTFEVIQKTIDHEVEVTKRQIIELNLEDSTNINSTDDSR